MSTPVQGERGHYWKMHPDSPEEIDIFALSEGYHNGPQCTLCGYSYCQHCNKGPQVSCGESFDRPDYSDENLYPGLAT